MRSLSFWASGLVVPLALLLFLQWPLREAVQAYSRQANDLGQILFALYVAVAVRAASRAGTHLVAGTRGHAPGRHPQRWRAWAVAACVGPFALFMLWASWAPTVQSVRGMERFAETFTPGYFLVKLALLLMVILVAWEAAAAVVRAGGEGA